MTNRTHSIFLLCLQLCLVGCGPEGFDELPADDTTTTSDALASSVLSGRVVAYATSTGSESGAKQSFGAGTYHATAGELDQVGYNAVRLIELAPAMRVRICHEYNPSLSSCEYAENLTGANKRVVVVPPVSRLDVRSLVVAYRDANYGGTAQGFEIGRHETSRSQLAVVGNDTISSIRIAPGIQVKLCSDNPETTIGARCQWVNSNTSLLPSYVDNSTSWLEIWPFARLHRDAAFAGVTQDIRAVTLTASELTVGNDVVSSLTVQEGMELNVCSDNPTRTVGYTCFSTRDSVVQLPSSIDNRTSWVESRVNTIFSPLNEEQFVGTTKVTLRAMALSPRDGELSGGNVSWRSDRDGDLGTGTSRTVNLSTDGCNNTRHRIFLKSVDSSGHAVETFRDVYVRQVC